MDLLVNTEDLYSSAAFGQEEVEPEWGVAELMQAQRQLRAVAVKQVEAAVLPLDRSPSFRGAYVGPHDEHGVQHTERLDTRVISSSFFRMAQQQGIVLYEACGTTLRNTLHWICDRCTTLHVNGCHLLICGPNRVL
jgi:hypothetical protein